MGTGAVSHGLNDQGLKLSTRYHLALRLRRSGPVPFFSLCASMAWTEETLLLPLHHVLPRLVRNAPREDKMSLFESS